MTLVGFGVMIVKDQRQAVEEGLLSGFSNFHFMLIMSVRV